MADIVDNRRKDFAADNRAKYMAREQYSLRQAVRNKLKDAKIKDISKGKDIDLVVESSKSTKEIDIGYQSNRGKREQVGTGNDQYTVGQVFDMDDDDGGRPEASDGEDSEANYNFKVTAQEFMDLFFDDLALPFQVKKMLLETESENFKRAGYVVDGSPSRLSIVRTYRNSIGRTTAERQDYLDQLEEEEDEDKKIELEEKIKNIPLFREVDLRYVNWVAEPVVKFKSVMFCVMDVSGSMEEDQRMLAKKFFLLLYVFLSKCYTSVEIVFIRHTTHAEETDEQTFFYEDMSGGTILSPTMEKIDEIIKERYVNQNYNIYVAQASDGDNWGNDNDKFYELLRNTVLPQLQYYVYIETPNPHYASSEVQYGTPFYKGLVEKFVKVKSAAEAKVSAKIVVRQGDIWKAFYSLFYKREGRFNHHEEE